MQLWMVIIASLSESTPYPLVPVHLGNQGGDWQEGIGRGKSGTCQRWIGEARGPEGERGATASRMGGRGTRRTECPVGWGGVAIRRALETAAGVPRISGLSAGG